MQGRPGIYRAEHQRIGGRGDLVLGETVCGPVPVSYPLGLHSRQTEAGWLLASWDSIRLLLYYYQYQNEHLSPAKGTKRSLKKKKPVILTKLDY